MTDEMTKRMHAFSENSSFQRKRRYVLRRFAALLLLMMAAVMLSGCETVDTLAKQSGLAESPYYHLGDTWWDHGGIEEYWFNQIPSEMNEIYRELYSRLSEEEESASLYAQVSVETFWKAYYAVLNDHPEFFWIGQNVEVSESNLSKKVAEYRVDVCVEAEDRSTVRAQIEAAADACISRIPQDASDYEKIKSVYEYIIDTTDYDRNSAYNQSIQSVLLGHASVCAGYARAFQYILHRMGMFCTYVTGKTNDGSDHAWNIVRIDGEYYNVDVTWGDPVFVSSQENQSQKSMNYNYLCCSDAELAGTHIAIADFALPACVDERYNYYKLNGMYYDTFDYDSVYMALMNSVWEERDSVSLKFGTDEAYQSASYELFSNGMLHDAAQYLMDLHGTTTWNYRYQQDDEFRLIRIYW